MRILSILIPLVFLLKGAAFSENVSIRFTSIAWEAAIEEVEYDGGEYSIPAFSRSEKQAYSGPAQVQFFRRVPNSAGEVERRVIASIEVQEGVRDFLFLWFPRGDGSFNLIAIPDDEDALKIGEARIFNASPYQLAIRTPDGVTQLAPGEYLVSNGERRLLPIEVAMLEEGSWRIAFDNMLMLHPEKRRSVFLTSTDSDSFKVTTGDGLVSTGPIQQFSLLD